MIPAHIKITSREFKDFYQKGTKKFSKHFIISRYNNNTCEYKYAVIISKKVLKTAVSRHKNKRKIYNIIRQIYPQFHCYNYTFINIKQDISTLDDQDLKKELIQLLNLK